jgi:hypothetical protein
MARSKDNAKKSSDQNVREEKNKKDKEVQEKTKKKQTAPEDWSDIVKKRSSSEEKKKFSDCGWNISDDRDLVIYGNDADNPNKKPILQEPIRSLRLTKKAKKRGHFMTINGFELPFENYVPGESEWDWNNDIVSWDKDDVKELRGMFFLWKTRIWNTSYTLVESINADLQVRRLRAQSKSSKKGKKKDKDDDSEKEDDDDDDSKKKKKKSKKKKDDEDDTDIETETPARKKQKTKKDDDEWEFPLSELDAEDSEFSTVEWSDVETQKDKKRLHQRRLNMQAKLLRQKKEEEDEDKKETQTKKPFGQTLPPTTAPSKKSKEDVTSPEPPAKKQKVEKVATSSSSSKSLR